MTVTNTTNDHSNFIYLEHYEQKQKENWFSTTNSPNHRAAPSIPNQGSQSNWIIHTVFDSPHWFRMGLLSPHISYIFWLPSLRRCQSLRCTRCVILDSSAAVSERILYCSFPSNALRVRVYADSHWAPYWISAVYTASSQWYSIRILTNIPKQNTMVQRVQS